jgi:hypothetical protein
MHLSEHLDTHGLTYSAFARQIGVSAETVRRYGKVTADSFYADPKAA